MADTETKTVETTERTVKGFCIYKKKQTCFLCPESGVGGPVRNP